MTPPTLTSVASWRSSTWTGVESVPLAPAASVPRSSGLPPPQQATVRSIRSAQVVIVPAEIRVTSGGGYTESVSCCVAEAFAASLNVTTKVLVPSAAGAPVTRPEGASVSPGGSAPAAIDQAPARASVVDSFARYPTPSVPNGSTVVPIATPPATGVSEGGLFTGFAVMATWIMRLAVSGCRAVPTMTRKGVVAVPRATSEKANAPCAPE